MKCGCSGYERLLELTICPEEDAPSEKEQELVFHNDDGSCQVVVVERNLRASDLCQLLALKNRVAKDVSWTIVEQWVDLGLERSLEDHEEVLAVYDMEANGKHTEKRFVFRKDFLKYEFFHSPQQFFPADMVDPSACDQLLEPHTLQMVVTSADECPVIGSQIWVREANKQVWSKVFLLLKDRTLYICHKVQLVSKLIRKSTIKN